MVPKCSCVDQSLDRAAFQKLDNAAFEALLAPVDIALLSGILKQGDLGKELQQTYFKGFSPGRLKCEQAVRFFADAARAKPGPALPHALLHSWLEAVPSARSISSSVLKREHPFAAKITQEFYDQLEAVIPAGTVAALQTLFPSAAHEPSESVSQSSASTELLVLAWVRDYRMKNSTLEHHAGSSQRVLRQLSAAPAGRSVLICLVDYVGSGLEEQAMFVSSILPLLAGQTPDWRERVLVVLGAITGFERGVDYLRDQLAPDVAVICGALLTDADRPFGPQSHLYDEDQRQQAQELTRSIGQELQADSPLGLDDQGVLIAFPEYVPGVTLPIVWRTDADFAGEPWQPLLPSETHERSPNSNPFTEQFIPAGQPFEAYRRLRAVLLKARRVVNIVDSYVDATTADFISELRPSVTVRIITSKFEGDGRTALRKLADQRRNLQVRTSRQFHDRFIQIDEDYFHLGSSIKDAGEKSTMINRVETTPARSGFRDEFERVWNIADQPW